MKKYILLIYMCMISISLVSSLSNLDIPLPSSLGDSYGTFKINTNISLVQTCSNATGLCDSCKVTSVVYPSGRSIVVPVSMTKTNTIFNYTLGAAFIVENGKYAVTGECLAGNIYSPWAYTFIVTPTGEDLTHPKALFYITMLVLMFIIFLVNVIAIPMLPKDNNKDDDGYFVSVNKLKYLRPVLYYTSYLLFMTIIFVCSNIALTFLDTELIGDLLFDIYWIMMLLLFPITVIWIIFIIVKLFQDKEMKRMYERGMDTGGSV